MSCSWRERKSMYVFFIEKSIIATTCVLEVSVVQQYNVYDNFYIHSYYQDDRYS
jgi:hypothetical protein